MLPYLEGHRTKFSSHSPQKTTFSVHVKKKSLDLNTATDGKCNYGPSHCVASCVLTSLLP